MPASPIFRQFAIIAAFGLAIPLSPGPARAQADQQVAITASDQMKYDVTAITMKKGQTLTITLTNKGVLPKVAMAHNLVILKPGTDTTMFATAASAARDNNYIPSGLADEVVGVTNLLGPGESDTVSFTPKAAGSYPYLCTFPGHALSGMHGVITVE